MRSFSNDRYLLRTLGDVIKLKSNFFQIPDDTAIPNLNIGDTFSVIIEMSQIAALPSTVTIQGQEQMFYQAIGFSMGKLQIQW